jgi:RHS repeat-associated protein
VDPSAVVAGLKTRAGSPVGPSVAAGFDTAAGGLKPRFAAADLAAEPAVARVTLPAQANAALHLEDAATGTAVDVTLQGAAAVAGQAADGYVVYPAASATGANVVQRAIASGTEDFVALDAKPTATQVAYDVSLGIGAAGLRLVGGTLEVLDAGGTPRLRVAPPYIVGADGAQTDATLAVAGCAVDTNPAPPWGRRVTPPGAKSCQVSVTWPGTGVVYPAILDPRWTTTGSMGTARQDHTMTLLANGKVLVTGGRSTTGTTGLATAELYDRTTGTWSATASMAAGRFMHRATQLNTGSNSTTSGKVLISGGINGTTSLSTFQLYDPTAGTWSAAANMNAARHGHTATLLADGKVLVVGGLNGTTTLATAAVYNPASGSGSWAATTGSIPPPGVKNHTATLIQTTNAQLNNKVLVVGGNSGSATLSTVYLFDPTQSAFSTLTALSSPREQHTAAMLPSSNGKILVAGGKNGSAVLATAIIFDPATSNGTWTSAGTMTSARVGHSATILPASIVANGSVLVAGGNNGSTTLSSAELFSGSNTWTATPSMPGPLQGQGAALLGNNMIIVAGGLSSSTTVVSTARLYDASFGLGCTTGSQCPTGFCVNGVCCDTACTNQCMACNQAGSLGTCSAKANNTACNDGNLCTQMDTCQTGTCTGTNPVVCTAQDQCHVAGTCASGTGICSNPTKPNGTSCNDGNLCTQTDTCQTGTCTGGNPVVCTAQDQCHVAGSCASGTGICSNPAKPDGTSCSDGNLCTQTDTCQTGTCTGANPVVCTAQDQCHVAGTCASGTGVCSNPTKPDGTTCSDGNNCTAPDACAGGVCTGTPLSQCGLTAPPLDRTIATDFHAANSFLYSGSNPVQTGVAPGAIGFLRAAVIRGLVTDRSGAPLVGATISIHGHPEFGQTSTRADGMFDIAANGGGLLNVDYSKSGFLEAQRQVNVPNRDYIWAPDVVMVPVDPELTIVNLSNATMQVAQGSVVTDVDGTRQETLLVPEDTTATMIMPDGTSTQISQMHVRLTEYTVGATGPKAMPAPLPPTSAYTYAVELSADEALAAGAKTVRFDRPLVDYVENFLGFPSGSQVPVGFYDRDKGAWIASDNGRVVKIVDIFGGMAELDIDGDEVSDDATALATLGITDSERLRLAQLYLPGQTLWRVSIPHFSSCDKNWPIGPPPDATPPNQPKPKKKDKRKKDPCKKKGSIIQCENQVLGELIPIVGTPFDLEYFSDRVPGFSTPNQVSIQVTGPTPPPPDVKRVEVEVQIAGRRIINQIAAIPNQSLDFEWDGKDAYGRTLQGAAHAKIAVRYVYPGSYSLPPTDERAFGVPSDLVITQNRVALEVDFDQVTSVSLGTWNTQAIDAIGGWDLSIHHAYSPDARQMIRGTGETIDGVDGGEVITTVAGTGVHGASSDGTPAKAASIYPIGGDIDLGPDGSLYFADRIFDGGALTPYWRVRKISPDGILTTVAGGGTLPDDASADGVHSLAEGFPATDAQFFASGGPGIALGPDGSLFIAAGEPHHILHVEPDGTLKRVVGKWDFEPPVTGMAGDGQPADQISTKINVSAFVIADDGSIYFEEGGFFTGILRRVSPDGIITTVAGNEDPSAHGFTPDGLPAKGNTWLAGSIAIGRDGSILFTGPSTAVRAADVTTVIRRIGIDGVLRTVAGNSLGNLSCFEPFDGPALGFGGYLQRTGGIALGPDSNLYMASQCGQWFLGGDGVPPMGVIRRLSGDGQVRTIAGGGPTPATAMSSDPFPYFDTDGLHGKIGDTTMARQWPIAVSLSLAVSADSVYFGGVNGGNRFPSDAFIYKVSSGLPGLALGLTQIPAEDASEIYEFNDEGRHLRTLDALTGAVKYQFGYGATGLVNSVTDTDGSVTTIVRDSSGVATAIVAPNGQSTTLAMGPAGYLAQITNPAGNAVTFTYGPTGLLATQTDLRGGNHTLSYDPNGLLTRDQNPGGGSWNLARSENGDSLTVLMTTAEGRQETHQANETSTQTSSTVTFSSGLSSSTVLDPKGSRTSIDPDGTVRVTKDAPDPRFGSSAPYVATALVFTPGGVVAQTQQQRSVTSASGPLVSLQRTITRNGAASNFVFDADVKRSTLTTAGGRQMTLSHDNHGRVVGLQRGNMAPISMVYNPHGRPASMTVGTGTDARITTWDYDALDRLLRRTDPAGHEITFASDNDNRITSAQLPGGASLALTYDAASDLMSVTPPGQPPHVFQRTVLGSELSYTPPAMGSPPVSAQFTYNLDNQLTTMLRLDGTTLSFGRDSGGRVASIGGPQSTVTFTYGSGGHIAGIASSNGVSLTVARDGFLPVGDTWAGPVTGAVTRTFNSNFNVATMSINGSALASYAYDPDGLMVQAGSLTAVRDVQTGSVLSTTHGVVSHSFDYNAFGERISTVVNVAGQPAFATASSRDVLGRTVTREQSVLGDHHVFDYHYDNRRRLIEVDRDGAPTTSYTYDANGNRLTRTIDGITTGATYDERDRQLTDGPLQFSYNANGELITKHDIATGANTSYAYDDRGRLRQVTVPSGSVIDYVLDGIGHRLRKNRDGAPIQAFLYDGALRPIAELDGANQVISRFVYGPRANTPEYFVRGGHEYRIVTDSLGSPRLIVDASSGSVVQQLDYDEFGKVTMDTNPGFQPFGFAGGLTDRDTGLVHFGEREYDPAEGRWMTADPLRFAGDNPNLFAYVGNDPVNFLDPTGLLQVAGDVQEDFPLAAEAIATILDRVGRTEIANLSLYGHAVSDDFVKEVLDRKSEYCVGAMDSSDPRDPDWHGCGQEGDLRIDIDRHVLRDFENGRITQRQFDATLLHEVTHLLNEIGGVEETFFHSGYEFENATYGGSVHCLVPGKI